MFRRKSECQIVQGRLSPYIDEQLNPADKERVESHLEGCQACLGELESLRSTVKLLHRVAMVSPPRSFAVVEAAPKPQPASARSFRAFRAATAVAALHCSWCLPSPVAPLTYLRRDLLRREQTGKLLLRLRMAMEWMERLVKRTWREVMRSLQRKALSGRCSS